MILILHVHIVSNVYKWPSRSLPLSLHNTRRRPLCLWDCGLCFEVLYFIHLPILLPTTYCLAAGIAGGWQLLPECGWCGRDLRTKRDLWVWEADAWAYSVAHWVKPCVIYCMFLPPLPRDETMWEGGIFPWWLVCVRYSTLRSGERPVGMKDGRFCLLRCGALTPAVSAELPTTCCVAEGKCGMRWLFW